MAKPMIYRWHGYGANAMAVARPNENNYLFLPGQLVCYLVLGIITQTGLNLAFFYFIDVMNTSLLNTIAHHELGLHLRNKLYLT